MTDVLFKWALTQGPTVAMLALILASLLKGLWLPKQQVDALVAEKEKAYAAMVREKDERYAQMVAAKDATIAAEQGRVLFRDQQIAERDREIVRERDRADQKDQYAFRLLEAGKQAAEIATAAIAAKRDAEIAAAAAQSAHRQGGAR